MHYSKNKNDSWSNSNDFHLRYLFQILNEIKHQQMKSLPKKTQFEIDQFFKIISTVSLLYNQICHLSKDDLIKQQFDYVFQLIKSNCEKSLNDYIASVHLSKNNMTICKEINLSFKPNIIENIDDSFADYSPIKEKQIIMRKMKKIMALEKKQYQNVVLSLPSNSQKLFKTPVKKNNKNHFNSVMNISNNSSVNHQYHSNAMYFNTEINPKKKSNAIIEENTKKQLEEKPMSMSIPMNYLQTNINDELATPIIKNNKIKNLFISDKSITQKSDIVRNKKTQKVSSYAKHLVNQFKNVIDSYGEEVKTSIMNNNTIQLDRSLSLRKRESKDKKEINISLYQINKSNTNHHLSQGAIKITKDYWK